MSTRPNFLLCEEGLGAVSIFCLLLRKESGTAVQDILKKKLKYYAVDKNITEWVHFISAGKLPLEDCAHF